MKIIQQCNMKEFSCRKNLEKISRFLLVVFLFVGVINIGFTNAYFSDIDTSLDNDISAGILDITLDNSGVYSSGLLYPTDSTTTSTILSNTGTLDSQYIVETNITGNVASVCDYITMTVTSPTSIPYTGTIEDFTSVATATVDTTWNFNFTISATAPPSVWGKTCYFKWIYTAWQDNLPDASSGFSSIKEKLGSIRIGKAVVMNEFIPNPIGLDDALKPNGEWVELYNNSSVSFDLSGWTIYDNDDSHKLYITNSNTNTDGTIIAPHGFLVVYKNGDADFILNNDTGSVRLATGYPIASSVVVDSYLYDGEKPEGYSWARIPDGVGTWIDPIPTPGTTNESIEEIIEPIKETTPVVGESIVPETMPEEIIETEENIILEVTTEVPPATEPEEVITEESEVIETPNGEVIKPEDIIASEPFTFEPEIEAVEEIIVEEPREPEVVEEPVIETVTVSQ